MNKTKNNAILFGKVVGIIECSITGGFMDCCHRYSCPSIAKTVLKPALVVLIVGNALGVSVVEVNKMEISLSYLR